MMIKVALLLRIIPAIKTSCARSARCEEPKSDSFFYIRILSEFLRVRLRICRKQIIRASGITENINIFQHSIGDHFHKYLNHTITAISSEFNIISVIPGGKLPCIKSNSEIVSLSGCRSGSRHNGYSARGQASHAFPQYLYSLKNKTAVLTRYRKKMRTVCQPFRNQ